jgi:preprotein translocase subunit SecE
MGRLLRKKPVTKKRKKQNDDSLPSSQADNGNDKLKSGSAVSAVSSQKKIPVAARQTSVINKGYAGKAVLFLREVRAELRKVTWPTRRQTVGSTVVVIILVMIISFFLGAVDIGLSGLVRTVLQ